MVSPIPNSQIFLTGPKMAFFRSEFEIFCKIIHETTESNKQLGIGEPIYRDLDLYDPYNE